MSDHRSRPSVNARAAPLVRRLIDDADMLRLTVERPAAGYTLIDGGANCRGGVEAGRRIAEICMGGLGEVALQANATLPNWTWAVTARSADPVLACLASQYAGWQLAHGEGDDGFFSLGSGPGRALARKEPLFDDLGYQDRAKGTVLVLETDRSPPIAIIDKICRDCGVDPAGLTIIITPTQSLAGTVQIVARVLEVALHKVHELKFPLDRIVDGMGVAPLPPPGASFMQAMGRTNDAIIFGGAVHLFVAGDEADASRLAEQLPSSASRDYGKPFQEIFAAVKGDFYAIDPMLFSPAEVTVTALDTGRSFRAGALDAAMVDKSFG